MLLVIYAYIRTYIHEYKYSLLYIEVYKAVGVPQIFFVNFKYWSKRLTHYVIQKKKRRTTAGLSDEEETK